MPHFGRDHLPFRKPLGLESLDCGFVCRRLDAIIIPIVSTEELYVPCTIQA